MGITQKLYNNYKKILFSFSIIMLASCHNEEKFNLNDNTNDFNEIIEAVIQNDSLKVLKDNKGNYAVDEYLQKLKITVPKSNNRDSIILISLPNERVIGDLFYFQGAKIKGFDKKDSLYILSQTSNPDSLKLNDKLLSKLEHTNYQKTKLEWKKGNHLKYFDFTIPIISKDKSKAYIESGYHCGGMCGGGSAYFLIKSKGKWKVAKKWGTWIS
jgi:hypothetical protein